MRYSAHTYAKALVEVLADAEKAKAGAKDEERIAKNFLALVSRNGDEMHLKRILDEASRFARGKDGIRKVTVESARKLTDIQKKMVEGFVKKGDVVESQTNTELIAGIRITLDDEMQFDGSLKHKLDKALGARI